MTPHLRGQVRAYVDGALPPPIMHVFDRHLVCCQMCRAAADQERRIVASLRSDTSVPHDLRTSLLELATLAPGERAASSATGPGSALGIDVPEAREPVPTVHPGAPALHRSPMRAAVVASIAAGASFAAAWGLAVAPLPGSSRTPSVRVPAGVASFGTAPVGLAGFGAANTPSSASTPGAVGSTSQVPRTSREPESVAGAPRASTTPAPSFAVTTGTWSRADFYGLYGAYGSYGPVRVSVLSSAQSTP